MKNKDIKLPNKLITVDYQDNKTIVVFEQELKDWIINITERVNKLSKPKK